VRDHLSVLGLELIVDEAEGYAFLRQRAPADGEAELRRLVARRPLSFPVSLLLALLRKKLAEVDAGGSETRVVLDRDQIVEMMRVFLAETTNEARLVERVDQYIAKVVEYGFLRRMRDRAGEYEIRRILKAFVDAQWLQELETRLATYRAHAGAQEEEEG
jgi:hypothetical protein